MWISCNQRRCTTLPRDQLSVTVWVSVTSASFRFSVDAGWISVGGALFFSSVLESEESSRVCVCVWAHKLLIFSMQSLKCSAASDDLKYFHENVYCWTDSLISDKWLFAVNLCVCVCVLFEQCKASGNALYASNLTNPERACVCVHECVRECVWWPSGLLIWLRNRLRGRRLSGMASRSLNPW